MNPTDPNTNSPTPSENVEMLTSEGVNQDVIPPLGLKKWWNLAGNYVPNRGKHNDNAVFGSLGQDPATTMSEKGIVKPQATPQNACIRVKGAGRTHHLRVECLE
jgi:hypothetical protein